MRRTEDTKLKQAVALLTMQQAWPAVSEKDLEQVLENIATFVGACVGDALLEAGDHCAGNPSHAAVLSIAVSKVSR